MPGGIIQLNAYGAQNQYLNGNPQMTFFKSVYRRYTNFSMETIRIELNGPRELSMENKTMLRAKIDRNGDLVTKMYFVFNLPDIFSGYMLNAPDPSYAGYQFQWVKSIGTTIINTATLTVGGNAISTLYGEWIRIWHELFSKENKNVFDQMTGNVPELFAPKYATGQSSTYPTSTLNPAYNVDPELFSASRFLKNPYLRAPSIRGRKIYTPLPFWFTTNPGLALPLLCLQYHEVAVNIELRKLAELYTVIETNPFDLNYKQRVAPSILRPEHQMNSFISLIPSSQFKNGVDLGQKEVVNGWGFDPHLEVQYIFLDEEERSRFASVSHEYLIEQVTRQEFVGTVGSSTLDLSLNNPVKALLWMAVRDDFEKKNIYNNYTNWQYEDISADSIAYMRNTYGEVNYKQDVNGNYEVEDALYKTYELDEISSKFNYNYFSRDIIKKATLLFNGVNRFETNDFTYFNYVQAYQHPLTGVMPGVHMYSFSLEPTLDQPSGACNMSRIHTVQLQIQTLDVLRSEEGSYKHLFNVYVYAINYNIFRVLSGMGNVGYTT